MGHRQEQQDKLDAACKAASGEGVGYFGHVGDGGSITLRRDEEFSVSHVTEFDSLGDALEFLESENR